MPILLALCSALAYGVSDYFGGRSSRRTAPQAIALSAELTLLVGLSMLVATTERTGPSGGAVGWGALAGLCGSLAVLGLYMLLARGNMTVIAPTTGVVAAVLPVVVGLVQGERPGPLAICGVGLAIIAVAVIGGLLGVDRDAVSWPTVVGSLAVGALFGLVFVSYAQAGEDAGWWPLLAARIGGVPLLSAAFLLRRRRDRDVVLGRASFVAGVVVGALVGLANVAYLVAVNDGLLSIVAVLVALYPASTVGLAAWLDHERPTRAQMVGMLAAGVAVTMITVGA